MTTRLLGKGRLRRDSANSISPMDQQVGKQGHGWRRVAVAAAILLTIAALGYGYVRFALDPVETVNVADLDIAEVVLADFRDFIPVMGNVVPRNTVYLDAVDGGQVSEVFIEEGVMVQAGQPLVVLKNPSLQLAVINSEAQLTEQVNALSVTRLSLEQNRLRNNRDLIDVTYRVEKLERQLRRYRQLGIEGGLTQETLDELEAEYVYQTQLKDTVAESRKVDEEFQLRQIDLLQAAIDSMNRNIKIARENLANLTLKAPISGDLTMLDAEVGQSLDRGQRVGQIDETAAFKVTAYVDEFYLSRIAPGNTASAEVDGASFQLEVDKVYTEVLNRQFQIDLVFVGQNPGAIRRGQTVRLNLDIGGHAQQALVVANGSFYDETGGNWAFVVDRNSTAAERRVVELGRRSPSHIEVLGGLQPGERIVTSSYREFANVNRLALTP